MEAFAFAAGLALLAPVGQAELRSLLEALARRDAEVRALRLAFTLEIEYAPHLRREPTLELGLWHQDGAREMLATLTGKAQGQPLFERFVWNGARGVRFKADARWEDYDSILAGRPPRPELAEVGLGRRSGKLLRASTPGQAGLLHAGRPWSEYLARYDLRILGRERCLDREAVVLLGDAGDGPGQGDPRYHKPFVVVFDDRATLLALRLETYEGWAAEPGQAVTALAAGVQREVVSTPDGSIWRRRTLVEVLEVGRLAGGVWIGTRARFSNAASTNSVTTLRVDLGASALGEDVPAALLDDAIGRGTRVIDAVSREEYYEGRRGDAEYLAERRYGEALRRAFPAVHAAWFEIEGRADDFSTADGGLLVLYTAAWVAGARPELAKLGAALGNGGASRSRSTEDWLRLARAAGIELIPARLAEPEPGEPRVLLVFLADTPGGPASPALVEPGRDRSARLFDPATGWVRVAWDQLAPRVDGSAFSWGEGAAPETLRGPDAVPVRGRNAVAVSAWTRWGAAVAGLLVVLLLAGCVRSRVGGALR